MPPRKRTRLSPSAVAPDLEPPCPQGEDGTGRVDEETHQVREGVNEGATGGPGSMSSSQSASGESIDPALLDEEEIPDAFEDDKDISKRTSPRGTKRMYAAEGGYNALKTFNGQIYSGMAIGGSHTWNYDQGTWHETKEEPDLWKIDYKTTKRRAGNAPKGSGAPVETEYHWLIVGHQHVRKVDANTYETHLTGSKYKLAHKAANSNSWSVPTVKAQREREVELLEDSKRRVQGLPPVLASERVKVEKHEKGQQKLDALFAKSHSKKSEEIPSSKKRRKD